MRTIFFGSPEIALPALNALAETTDLRAVVSQPDRPAGRGLELKPPAVALRARELGVELVQPTKIRTAAFAEWVRGLDADVALVMAYGRILPPAVLAATRRGFLNLHASLLPRYRGAAPIQWSLVHGETETGISLMQMDEGCDTGAVYTMRAIPVPSDANAAELAAELGKLAETVVREDLPRAMSGDLEPRAQDDSQATLAPLIRKSHGHVDWSKTAKAVHDHARGMTPWPGACAWLDGKRFKLTRTTVADESGRRGEPGTILDVGEAGALVACGQGAIRVLRGQLEGRRECDATALAHGRCLLQGGQFSQPPEEPAGGDG